MAHVLNALFTLLKLSLRKPYRTGLTITEVIANRWQPENTRSIFIWSDASSSCWYLVSEYTSLWKQCPTDFRSREICDLWYYFCTVENYVFRLSNFNFPPMVYPSFKHNSLLLLIFVLPTKKYLKWLLYLKRIINPEDQMVEVYGSPTDEKRKPGPNENPVSLPSPCHLSCHSAVWQVVDGNARDKMGNSVIYEDHGNAWSDILDKEAEDGIGNMVTNIWIPILNKSNYKICHCISVLCTSMQ